MSINWRLLERFIILEPLCSCHSVECCLIGEFDGEIIFFKEGEIVFFLKKEKIVFSKKEKMIFQRRRKCFFKKKKKKMCF